MSLPSRIKFVLLNWLLRPRGMAACGDATRVSLPRRIGGRPHLRFGRNVRIASYSWIEALTEYGEQRFKPTIVIHDNVAIGHRALIIAASHIEIGEGCLFSEGVYISDHRHAVMARNTVPLVERPLELQGDVHIGPRCFLGFRACVMPGVTLGEGCVVGAHAVVTRSFPAGSVLAGCPARLLRTIEGFSG